jgi:hypothetical protein
MAQMVRIDENQEAIAIIRMAIDNNNRTQLLEAQTSGDKPEPDLEEAERHGSEQHWIFGSPSGTRRSSQELEEALAPSNHDFISFDEHLRIFITHNFPEEAPRYEDLIYVC